MLSITTAVTSSQHEDVVGPQLISATQNYCHHHKHRKFMKTSRQVSSTTRTRRKPFGLLLVPSAGCISTLSYGLLMLIVVTLSCCVNNGKLKIFFYLQFVFLKI